MKTYIALLRGINVSGQKLIKMADLRGLIEDLGFKKVESYIQSGNLVFDFDELEFEAIQLLIHKKIKEHYGFEVPVLVRDTQYFNQVLAENPMRLEGVEDPKKFYVTLLNETPDPEKVEILKQTDYPFEFWFLGEKCVYLYTPNGYGKAKMTNTLFEKKLGVSATTRNWNSFNILAEMANDRMA